MSSVIRLPLPVIPDPNSSRACQVFADTIVDGAPARMLLDTGTSQSYVPYREALQPGDVHVETLQWGALIARNLSVTMNAPDWPHICDFRFGDGILELDQSASASDLLPLPTPADRTPAVPVHWGSASTTAVWDTGSGITIVNRSFAEAHPEIVSISAEFGRGTGITGETGRNPKGRLAPCRIGKVLFPEQDCGVTNSLGLDGIDIILGLPLISSANWYMDFPRRRWTNSRI
jgi:hypothetical protein